MVNDIKIKKYWILTFCMVFCSLITFAQDFSDQEIGFDVAKTTIMLKQHGVVDQEIAREIAMLRQMEKNKYVEMKKVEADFFQKIKSGQSVKGSTSRAALAPPEILAQEKAALIAFYNSTNGSGWKNTVGGQLAWPINDPNAVVTSSNQQNGWYGVTVGADGRVTMLDLQFNNLVGTIPADISKLSNLNYLSLGSNPLEGDYSVLGQLVELKLLSLGGNNFNKITDIDYNNKILPQSFQNLIKLEHLGLNQLGLKNNLSLIGENLKNLKILWISGGGITGALPASFSNLTKLERIDIANNYIDDISSLSNIISLNTIYGYNNRMKSFSFFTNLINLEYLNLYSNELTGDIPSHIRSFSKLRYFTVMNNKLSGLIPDLSGLPLSDFYFNNNKFRFIDFVNEFQAYKVKIPSADKFRYNFQAKINTPETVTKGAGQSIDLKMFPDGDTRYLTDDTYQWFKNGIAITSATSRVYTIPSLLATDAATYVCKSYHLTNPDMSPLVLEREPITLKISVSNCTPKTGTLNIPTEQIAVGKTAKFSFEETTGTVIAGEAVNYKWTITDTAGQTVNSITTTVGVHSFVFAAEGKYSVNLVVTGADGCVAAFNQEVTIVPEVQCLNENISFSFETTAPNLSYVWTATNAAGAVVNSSTASPSSLYNVSFATPGVYAITMTATDTVTQCFETFTKNVTIESCAPTNCMVHFNFNFKIPDTGQGFGGLVLDLGSRMNIANGVVDFLKANSNKKLFATTFDMTNKGVNAVMVNKEITVNPGDVYKVGTANEISNSAPTVIRIQDNSYSNTFSTLINSGILKNTALKNEGIDVSFFIISEDNNTSSLAGARSAYQALLNSGKAKKIFFVFVNEGKFSYVKLVGLTNRKVTITPTQFLAEIMGSTPINYASTNSILNSDFVQFSKAEIANVGFKKVFNDFLQKGYDDVSTKCEDVESCTKKNLYTPEIKRLFLNLANKLKNIPAGSDANTYAQKELAVLAPYTIDLKPIIYNFINTSSTISFSFSETSLENDVQLPKLASGSIVDIDLSQYTDIGTKTPISTVFNDGKIDLTNGFVRNIDFCVKELSCVSHVAVVLDESGSIDLKEMNKIKKQLKGFVYQQGLTNEKIGSNIHISLTGMSDSDDPTKRRTDFILPIKASTDPSVLGKFYTWIDDLGFRNGQTGISAGSDYWYSGLDQALKYELKPDVVIMITDGCQTDNAGNLQTKMMSFNNAKGSSSDLPHLYVVGIENGFYVDKPSTGKIADRNEDPNYNTGLQKRSLTAKVAARLTKSLQYLLGFTETEFPVSSINDFKTATYFGHDNFNLLALDETYISDKLADSDIVCGDSAIKDFCDDCFSFKPEPDHEYLLSAWVKEESFVQVKSYMNSAINIVFYRQKEALDIPGQIIATEIAVPSGEIIDGWQRIVKKIKVPSNAITIGFTLENKSASIPVYFDDIRIHPLKGSVKSFVYDPETFKLMSELDENNYSTFYEYDNEGGLVRVKKETSKGIKTIQETRSGNFINTKE